MAPALVAAAVVLVPVLAPTSVIPLATADARTVATPAGSPTPTSAPLLPIDLTLGTGAPITVSVGGLPHVTVTLPDLGGLLGRSTPTATTPTPAPSPHPSAPSTPPSVSSTGTPAPSAHRSTHGAAARTPSTAAAPATTTAAGGGFALPTSSRAAATTVDDRVGSAGPAHTRRSASTTHRAQQRPASLLSQAVTPGSPAMLLLSVVVALGLGVAVVVVLGGRRRAIRTA